MTMNKRAHANILRAVTRFEKAKHIDLKCGPWFVVQSLSSECKKSFNAALTEICETRNCEPCGYWIYESINHMEFWLMCDCHPVAWRHWL